jgi:hypothetical protein
MTPCENGKNCCEQVNLFGTFGSFGSEFGEEEWG